MAAAEVAVHPAAVEANRGGPGEGQLAEKEVLPQVKAVKGLLRQKDKRDQGWEGVLEQEDVKRQEQHWRKLKEQMQAQGFHGEESTWLAEQGH